MQRWHHGTCRMISSYYEIHPVCCNLENVFAQVLLLLSNATARNLHVLSTLRLATLLFSLSGEMFRSTHDVLNVSGLVVSLAGYTTWHKMTFGILWEYGSTVVGRLYLMALVCQASTYGTTTIKMILLLPALRHRLRTAMILLIRNGQDRLRTDSWTMSASNNYPEIRCRLPTPYT